MSLRSMNTTKKSNSSYRKPKVLKPVGDAVVRPREKTPSGRPLVPGIKAALTAMAHLGRYIKTNKLAKLFTVNIHMGESEWFLVVKGVKLDLDYYEGHNVLYVQSAHVGNPKARV